MSLVAVKSVFELVYILWLSTQQQHIYVAPLSSSVPASSVANIRGRRFCRDPRAEDIGKRRLYQNPTARVDEIGKCHFNMFL